MKNYSEVTNEWLELKRLSVKYATFVKYEAIINKHIQSYFGDYFIDQVNDTIVLEYFNMLLDSNSYANSTMITIRYILKAIGYFIQKKYDIQVYTMDLIKINKTYNKVTILTNDQKTSLSNYCFKHYKPISLAVLIALYGGLRIGEICALKWSDICIDEGYITVNQTIERLKSKDTTRNKTSLMSFKPKTDSSKRIVPIPMFLIEYIQQYQHFIVIDSTDNYILTNSSKMPEPRTTQYRFHRLCKEFKFSINFHSLRHSYATHCIMQDIDTKSLSEMLGHSTVGTTLNLYVHSSLEFKLAQVQKISRA